MSVSEATTSAPATCASLSTAPASQAHKLQRSSGANRNRGGNSRGVPVDSGVVPELSAKGTLKGVVCYAGGIAKEGGLVRTFPFLFVPNRHKQGCLLADLTNHRTLSVDCLVCPLDLATFVSKRNQKHSLQCNSLSCVLCKPSTCHLFFAGLWRENTAF